MDKLVVEPKHEVDLEHHDWKAQGLVSKELLEHALILFLVLYRVQALESASLLLVESSNLHIKSDPDVDVALFHSVVDKVAHDVDVGME